MSNASVINKIKLALERAYAFLLVLVDFFKDPLNEYAK